MDKGPKIPNFHRNKKDVILNITKVKYNINFQIKPLMVQNKIQSASNPHRYKKIIKKMH